MTDRKQQRPRGARAAKTSPRAPAKKKPEKLYRSIAEVRKAFYPAEDSAQAPWNRPRRHTPAVFGPDSGPDDEA
jgi:hypothetical protein